ncbi:MAG TPA: RNA polymerase subunit sigma-70 [Opitutaceae bacterium]|nr:RNA polymerase subunit sigma-70 [Opitutaceae bacterium]
MCAHIAKFEDASRKTLEEDFARYQSELRLHCYRMMGSFHDAEDLTQETLLRAFRGWTKFKRQTSVRRWLYRIATNACLNALEKRSNRRRLLPDAFAPTTRMPQGDPPSDVSWLEPFPDFGIEQIVADEPAPNARYERWESIRLAFVAAIQHLPARQRAVLLLRDVVGWTAEETASALSISLASANSALQRARAAQQKSRGWEANRAIETREEQGLIDQYVTAWETGDLPRLVRLLREDATLVMPPRPEWYRGRVAIEGFFQWAFDWVWGKPELKAFRLRPIKANGRSALAMYLRPQGETHYHAHALHCLNWADGKVSAVNLFVEPKLFTAFQLPRSI